jgi:hypothetical protein
VPACSGYAGGNDTDFWDITATTCTGTLAGGASCTVDLRHSPPPGSSCGGFAYRSAEWRVTDGAATIDTPMAGYSNTLEAVFPTPAQSDFGSQVVGTSSPAQTITVTNTGSATRTISTAPDSTASYTVSANTCTVGTTLMPGDNCTFSLRFAPTGSPGFRQEIIDVNAGTIVMFHVANGTALSAAALDLSPPSVSYPPTTSGGTSTAAFTVTNTGGVATAATPTPALSGPDAGQFAIINNTCSGALAGGDDCTFEVEFNPTGAGARSATVTVTAGGGLTDSSTLSGTGLAPALLGISPSTPQTCPAHWAGSDVFSCTTYTISNGGGSSAALTVGVTSDFDIDAASTCVTSPTLAPAGTCSVIVVHTPTDVGADAGTLTVSSPGVSSVTGMISSSGIPALERTAGSPAFGNASTTGMGVTQVFTIENQANPATSILTYSVTGTHGADFDVTADGCSGGTLSSGADCDITVRFLPSATGARTGTLTVTDGTGNKTEVIAMTGTGT